MSAILPLILWAVAILIFIPPIFFILECLGYFFLRRSITGNPNHDESPPDVAILIPAHNEGVTIATTLKTLLPVRRDHHAIHVIADNCTDDTATLARKILDGQTNTFVHERLDRDHRGKGFALAFGLDKLIEAPPDIVMIMDADCKFRRGDVDELARVAYDRGRPVQSLYLMERPLKSSPAQAIAAFAWMVMNQVRMGGLFHLFDVTRLTGSGMAFPYKILREYFQGSANIVEDLALSLKLIKAGHPPALLSQVEVVSMLPTQASDSVSQRARWEHGSLAMTRKTLFPMLWHGIRHLDVRSFAVGLDISILPLVMMSGVMALSTAGFLMLQFFVASAAGPAFTGMLICAIFALTLAIVWFRLGRTILPVSEFSGFAGFILQKLAIYGQKGRQSSRQWTRTNRDPADASSRVDDPGNPSP